MQNTLKNYIIKTNIFNSDNNNFNNINKNIKENNIKNLDLFMAYLSSYTITITYIC